MKQWNKRGRICVVMFFVCFCVAQLWCATVFGAELAFENGSVVFNGSASRVEVETPSLETKINTEILQDHGVFTVAYSENYYPFSYTDSNGKATGMGIAIMDYLAEAASIEMAYISVDEVRQTNAEVDINLAMLAVDQIEGVSTRSTAYTSMQMMLVSHSKEVDTTGATVGHLPYYYLEEGEVAQRLKGCIPYVYFTYAEMAQDFMEGDLDNMLVTSLVSSEMLETSYDIDVFVVPSAVNLEFYMTYSDGLSRGEITIMDSVIRSLDSDYIYSLMLQSVLTSSEAQLTPEELLRTYAVEIVASIVAIFLIIIAIVFKINYNKRQFLENTINVDDLTGLMTERKFIEESIKRLQENPDGAFALVTIDIDRFKTINEIYGYEMGTKVIVRFGEILKGVFDDNAIVARFFADNFGVLYQVPEEKTSVIGQEDYEVKMRHAMQELLGKDYRIATSAGIYLVKDRTLPLSHMIDCANMARRKGKASYGITQCRFTEELGRSMEQKNAIVLSMEDAMASREFQVYYQPKISLKTGKIIGSEALVRWIMSDGKQRFPDQFIPIFESNGFISKLDHFMLDSVCQFLKTHPQAPSVAINFSGYTVMDKNMIKKVERTIEKHGVDASRMEIEITESAVVNNFERVLEQTTKLKALGFSISMDDFGAGISSLNRLKDMDIDVLKIDRVFLGERVLTQRSISILEHIIAMAEGLGIATVAEGVEYPEHVALLKSLACDMAQGYHYARPMPEKDYLTFIETDL